MWISPFYKETITKPQVRKYWKIPPKESGAFVANMEDVLAIYELPYSLSHKGCL
jgi:hypothetical protein